MLYHKKTLKSSSLETEYLEMKRVLYEKFFRYIMFFILGAIFIETPRALIYGKLAIFIFIFTMLLFVGLFMRCIWNLKENQESVITIFFIMLYLASMILHYHADTGYFSSPLDSFYLAYTSALVDRMVASRIPKLCYRTTFSVVTTLIRIVIIPIKDKGMLAAQLLTLLAETYLDMDKEKQDHNLFKSYFYSKEQLMKFKNLVVHDIPEEIAIITRDLQKCLFVNRSFEKLLGPRSFCNIRDQINQFILEDASMVSDTEEGIRKHLSSQQTLLTFLNNQYSQSDNPSLPKVSFNISLTDSEQGTGATNKDEHKEIFEAKVFQITWDEQQAIAIVLHNITQQQTILNLKLANAHKDSVLATVSHELRTPLHAMLGMIQVMHKKIADQELVHYLDICKNNGTLLLSLVNSILDLNQLRANRLKLYPEEVNLDEFLADMLSLFEYQCMQKGLTLKLKLSPEVTKFIVTDKNRLSQILINLIGNAVKFTNEGGITIVVDKYENDGYIKFSVIDTGIGIKEEDKSKLFQVFGKLEQENTKINQQGVGLGLTISNTLAKFLCSNENVGGVRVESEYKKGSIFSFLIKENLHNLNQKHEMKYGLSQSCVTFPTSGHYEEIKDKIESHLTPPLKKPSSFQTPQKLLKSLRETKKADRSYLQSILYIPSNSIESKQTGPCILIVDDNPFNITVAQHLIGSLGYKTQTALSGKAAIDICLNTSNDPQNEPISLILMDCQMPGMDGYEATRRLIKLMKEKRIPVIPIISLSANDSEDDKEACWKAGMNDCLSKPLKEDDLISVFKKYGLYPLNINL